MKLIIACIPLSWDIVLADFFYSYCNMQGYALKKGYNWGISTAKTAFIDVMRYKCLQEAWKYEPDYILWLDADQWYPPETPIILTKHIDSGKLVVGGISPRRGNRRSSAYTIEDNGECTHRDDVKPNTGLHKIDGMGLGGVMMNPNIFDALDITCFQTYWNQELQTKVGEDVAFYAQCKDLGIDVWCDSDLVFDHLTVQKIGFADEKN